MEPWTTSLFSLLILLLLPRPSLLYSLKNCTVDFYDQNRIVCDFNKLTRIPAGIPKSATSLSFFYNKLEQIQRTDLTGFTNLEFLHLGFNRISHIEDEAFSDLSRVTDIVLASNKLTDLTDHVFKGLYNLTTLYLNGNQIHSASRLAFKPLKKLQILDIGSNDLFQMSDVVNIVSHCPALKNLDLYRNNLTSFDSDIFPFPLLNLLDLDLSSNPLKRFSIHLNVFPKLKAFVLSGEGPDFDWDVSNKALTSVRSLTITDAMLTLQNYKSIFQSLDSVESITYSGFSWWSDKGLLEITCEIPTLQELYFFGYLIPIVNESLLQSCTNLTKLHLQFNSMSDLTDASLKMLTRLTELTIDQNKLSRIPLTIRNMSTLTHLSFEENVITDLQCSDLTNLRSLTELNLKSNRIFKLDNCVFKDLQNLKVLEIQNNFLTTLSNSFGFSLHNLVTLNTDGNNLGWLQKGTFQNLPALLELNVNSVRETIVEKGAFMGITKLNQLTYSPYFSDIGSFTGLQKLQKLVLFLTHKNINAQPNKDLLVYLPSLQELTIEVDNPTCFTWTGSLLMGLSNLTTLSFKKYCCSDLDEDKFISIPQLLNLYITDCHMFTHGSRLFLPLTELKVLDLTNSNIESLDFLVDANLTKVEQLILKNNNLKIINETVFHTLPSLKYLDLSGNPFACNCSNADFIEWAIRNKQVQVANAFQYRCSSPLSEEGHFLMDFNVQSCWEFAAFLCFISSFALVLLTLLTSLIFHFLRWQLVYGYYLLLAYLYDSKKRRQGCPDIYDAFVSYNVHDKDWVYGELMPELEEQQGWRLCLHHRDFEPGKPIIENITDAIYSSRKTLCVISRRYLESEWCSREIQLASFRLFDEQKDVLILLFLEEISSYQLSPFYRMRKLVKSHTYLSWTKAQSHKGLFWEKVRRALQSGDEPVDDNNPLTG